MSNTHRTQPPAPAVWEVDRVRARQHRAESLKLVSRSADLVVALGMLIAIGGMVAGFLVAVVPDEASMARAAAIAIGIAIGLGSVVVGAVLVLLGHWANAWAEVSTD